MKNIKQITSIVWKKTVKYKNTYKLAFAILIAITIALALTVVSVALYVATGTSKLDLSRPGYEEVRKKVSAENEEDKSGISPIGAIDKKLLDDYLAKYKKQQQRLQDYDSFDPKNIEDIQLGLESEQVVLPNDGVSN